MTETLTGVKGALPTARWVFCFPRLGWDYPCGNLRDVVATWWHFRRNEPWLRGERCAVRRSR